MTTAESLDIWIRRLLGNEDLVQMGHAQKRDRAAPLLTVEMSTSSEFLLSADDADVLIRCPDGDVTWQKERLLNHAFAALPSSCRYVAWVDCDLLSPRTPGSRMSSGSSSSGGSGD